MQRNPRVTKVEALSQASTLLQPLTPAPVLPSPQLLPPTPFPHLPTPFPHFPQDSDERAVAYVAGPAPCRWGPFGSYDPLGPHPDGAAVQPPPVVVPAMASAADRARATELRRRHPLYQSIMLMLLTEIINSRLFTTVRDTLGLTYDVSFEVRVSGARVQAWGGCGGIEGTC